MHDDVVVEDQHAEEREGGQGQGREGGTNAQERNQRSAKCTPLNGSRAAVTHRRRHHSLPSVLLATAGVPSLAGSSGGGSAYHSSSPCLASPLRSPPSPGDFLVRPAYLHLGNASLHGDCVLRCRPPDFS
ncbi:unnamed protein product [Linum trigynum]|uniref:Uncharacterized protein n=1 Tax=Linum trigynum TaxID=586398 RepID=A0AAV2E796_9ROSI